MTDRYVTLHGGPLDGTTFPGAPDGSDHDGAYMIVPGEMARAVYEPRSDDDPNVWHFAGWIGGVPGDVPEGDELEALIDDLGPYVPPPDAAELLRAVDDGGRDDERDAP